MAEKKQFKSVGRTQQLNDHAPLPSRHVLAKPRHANPVALRWREPFIEALLKRTVFHDASPTAARISCFMKPIKAASATQEVAEVDRACDVPQCSATKSNCQFFSDSCGTEQYCTIGIVQLQVLAYPPIASHIRLSVVAIPAEKQQVFVHEHATIRRNYIVLKTPNAALPKSADSRKEHSASAISTPACRSLPNREGIRPQAHLADFKGIPQADAYSGYACGQIYVAAVRAYPIAPDLCPHIKNAGDKLKLIQKRRQ